MKNKTRKLLRIKKYDYCADGYYFVTACVKDRKCLLGEIKEGKMYLNQNGETVNQCWMDMANHYPIVLDEHMVMPNHLHGIIQIVQQNDMRAGYKPAPTVGLSEIVRGFKTFSSKRINNDLLNKNTFKWQRSFYDHIIRDERDLLRVRKYIANNPINWDKDKNNVGEGL